MSKTQECKVRIEPFKKQRLKKIAECKGQTPSQIIRGQIDVLLNNEVHDDVKKKLKDIVKELRQPFAYFKTDPGRKYALKERTRREKIVQRIELSFNLKK